MPKPGPSQSDQDTSVRAQHRRAKRLLRRGEERRAIQLMRECSAREPSGMTYCWLAEGLLAAGRQDEALEALKQALFAFRYDHLQGRAGTVAQWILKLDPADAAARKVAARAQRISAGRLHELRDRAA